MKQVFQIILSLGIGILIGWFIGCNGKVQTIEKEKIVVKIDTIVQRIEIKVPVPQKRYVFLTDTVLKNITNERLITQYCTDTISGMVETNVYSDTIINNDFKFEYEIQTLGELIHFNPIMTIFPHPCPKSNKHKWIITSGISNKGNFKFGGGYKGWVIEAEMKTELNQVFFGYHYQF
jgi:hypothetical protein